MIPVIESYTTNTATTSNSLTLTKPANVSAGDLLLLIVGSDDTSNNQQFDTFTENDRVWELIAEQGNAACDCHIAAFYRVADGTEGSTVTVPAASSDDTYGWYLRISGARQIGSPVHVYGQVNTTNGTSHTFPSLKTVFKDCLTFAVFAYDGGDSGTFTVSGTDWSKQDELKAGTGSGNASGAWATKEMATPGDTEDITFTSSPGDGGCGFQFAIARNGAPPIEIKEAVLRNLDELWNNRGPENTYVTDGEFVSAGDELLYVHGYDKQDDAHTYIRIKNKTSA